jgi:hypothetical protein
LKANEYLSEIGGTAFRLSNLNYVGVSSPEKLPMTKGGEISFAFEFIPELRAGMNGITFIQDCKAPNSLPDLGIMLMFHRVLVKSCVNLIFKQRAFRSDYSSLF